MNCRFEFMNGEKQKSPLSSERKWTFKNRIKNLAFKTIERFRTP